MTFKSNTTDIVQAFQADIVTFGLIPPATIESGRLFRCKAEGKKTGLPGWGIIYLNPDGSGGGCIGMWGGQKQNVFYGNAGNRISNNDLTPEQQAVFQKQMDEARGRLQAEIATKQKKAAGTARQIWEKSKPADPGHLYLKNKGIESHGIRQAGKVLIVPLYSTDGLVSLQRIFPDGGKRYHPGGQVKGCSYSIGDPAKSDIVYICEGFATGASIHEAINKPVVIAFNSGNLKTIAQLYFTTYSSKNIIIAADNDIETKKRTGKNTGLKAATEAAKAIGAELCICPVNSDFNDLQHAQGLGAVREALKKTKWFEKKTTGLPQGFTAQELLCTRFPDPRWAVKDILPEGLNILGGKPKAGKSIIGLNLALAISLGGKALQSIDVEKGSVIYLALEDTPRRLKKRIEQMLQYADEVPANLHLFTDWPRMGQGGVKALDSIIKSTDDTRLIIIDTLAKIRPPGTANGNLYAEDYETVSQLKKIADNNGVSILLIHHLRKMLSSDVFDMFSGTFGLSGAADGLMVMARNKSGQMVFSLTGRDVEQQEFVLEFDAKMLSWKLIGKAAEIQSTEKRQKIFDALKEAEEGLTPTNLAEVTGLKIHYIKKVLLTLLKEGSIIKIDRGIYKGTYGTNGTKGTNGTYGTMDEIDMSVPSEVPKGPEGVRQTVRPEPLMNKPLNHKGPLGPLVPNIPGDSDAEYF